MLAKHEDNKCVPRNRTEHKTKAEQGGDSVRPGSRRNERSIISMHAGMLSSPFVYTEKEFRTRLAQIKPQKYPSMDG